MTDRLDLAHKVNRLFAFYHRRGEPEIDVQAVAIWLGQRIDRDVSPEMIHELRTGDRPTADPTLLSAMCEFFGVDNTYLTESTGADYDLDQRLRLWTLVRDKGIHLAMRAHSLSRAELETLICEIESLPTD